MTILEIRYQAIEDCAGAARGVVKELTYSGQQIDTSDLGELVGGLTGSDAFGQLPKATDLAEAVNSVETALGREFEAARGKIEEVAGALDQVEKNVRAANKASTVPA
ncbi:hypothetical protein AB0I81_28070 [Nonomuraea sp. NPDC050404]|uniref:hypothetical protein n=1 Tax=Nonomuraea sp. NPDC050404 TaxID=3155783 RepID=UPI0034093F92